MDREQQGNTAARVLIISAAFVIVIAGMRAAEPMLVPFLLSVFIAVIAGPPMFWLSEHGLPKPLALLLVIGSLLVGVLAMAALVGSSVDDFTRALPGYQARLNEELAGLINLGDRFGVEFSSQWVLQYLNPSVVMSMVASTLSGFGNVLTNGFLILLTVAFILLEAASFPSKLRQIGRNREAPTQGGVVGDALAPFTRFAHTVRRYMAIKSAVSLATGVVIGLWLLALGVDYPLLWALLAFLLNYVPNIGSIIAAVPAMLLAFIQLGAGSAALVAGGYLAVNTVMGNIIEPRFMGRGLGLSTLVVFLSLVFWGWVLGPVGMLLSVPLTMTLKIALESRSDTHWLAVLLGPEHEHLPDEDALALPAGAMATDAPTDAASDAASDVAGGESGDGRGDGGAQSTA